MFPSELGQGKAEFAKLSSELERQADIYKGLGVNKDAIMKLLAPRPDGLPETLKIPVVTLGTSVDLKRQVSLAGIKMHGNWLEYRDRYGGITFSSPHLIWMQEGSQYLNKDSFWVRSHLGGNERPATLFDGVAFGIVYPGFRDVLQNHSIELEGTFLGRRDEETSPYLHLYDGVPRLISSYTDDSSMTYGFASCGG